MRVYVDIETRSRVDLKKFGVYRYCECPDFRILMAAWCRDRVRVPVLTDLDDILDHLRTDLRAGHVMVAHNAQFERVCFSRALGMRTGRYLDPEQWHDTAAVAAEHGYPATLEGCAKALGGEQKDNAGTRLINMFSIPNRKGQFTQPHEKPDEWMEFMAYCAQDVVTLIDVDEALGDFPTETERQVFYADQHINDRGIRIDRDMATLAQQAAEDNRMVQELRVMYLTGVANPNSQPQFLKWCQEAISPRIQNLKAETVERLLASPKLALVQREVLELRQELALVASKKYTSALGAVTADDRLRGTLKFFGAHTGRWSGRGTQVQNLPREAFTKEVDGKEVWDGDAEAIAILNLKTGAGASALELKKLVRPMFWGPFTVVDYAAIEARVIAWLAGEQWALDAFTGGRDIYVETANRMGGPDAGMTRAHGKVAVLALGYQGGINSLKAMAGDPEALAQIDNPPGVKIGDASWYDAFTARNPDIPTRYLHNRDGSRVRTKDELVDAMLRRIVDEWRQANPRIFRLWRSLQDAVADAGSEPMAVGARLRASREGDTFRLHLPSGRAITYHGMRWEKYRVQDPEKKRWIRKEGWRYDDPKKPGMRIGTYGGRLTENATQAVARDLMAEALVRLHDKGYEPVAHVHDEIIVEGEHDWHDISDIMCTPPAWADGLPIDGDGFTTDRYRKG